MVAPKFKNAKGAGNIKVPDKGGFDEAGFDAGVFTKVVDNVRTFGDIRGNVFSVSLAVVDVGMVIVCRTRKVIVE